MEFTLTKKVTRKMIEDLLTTALEGGSNYWYWISDDAKKMVKDIVPKDKTIYFTRAFTIALLEHDIEIPISDENGIVGVISKKTMTERLQLLFDDENFEYTLRNLFDGTYDADDADVIFQYLAMGQVIYA